MSKVNYLVNLFESLFLIIRHFINMRLSVLFILIPTLIFGQSKIKNIELLLSKKEFLKAEQLAIVYVSKNPNNIKVIELLGDAYGHQKKWGSAIKQYKLLIEKKPNSANYNYKYGGVLGMEALKLNKFKALLLIGDIKKAFLKAADLDPSHIETRWALVELYMQLPSIFGGSQKKALQFADQLEQLSSLEGYLAKGYIYEYDDKPKLAEQYYKKAIIAGDLLDCFLNSNDLKEDEYKHNDSSHRNALHYQFGKVCADYKLQLNKGEKCLLLFIKNHSSADGVPIEWAYYRLAQIYRHKGHKNKAIKWITKALTVRPNFKQAVLEKELILELN